MSRILPVPEGLEGERIDVALATMLGLSRARSSALVEGGAVQVGNRVVAKSHRLAPGETIQIREIREMSDSSDGGPFAGPPTNAPSVEIPILWEDDDVVVIDKPAGVAAHPSPGWSGPTVTDSLSAAGHALATAGAAEREGVVHRLDVGTTGAMVVAKSAAAYTSLKRQFKERTVDKQYHAVVHGLLDPLVGTIDAPIDRHPSKDYKWAVVAGGRESVTHYETLEAWPRASLVKVHLETGRTHQIRVHMAAMRHPCVGDVTYGADPTVAKELGLTRQWLHARQLGFEHPHTGEYVSFDSPYPIDLEHALARLQVGLSG
ncbi:MAG: RNA pseudouridine synthase [Micrococcales bacterium]|nr:RNA pseudouridine synthase [Micrococcales bacterium]MEC7590831.1 RluA family pseudouridine synthase [Actinomycetota bacterium]MEC8504249.1 RluA family pseudouridine synthase [Actinomycetota bacterium]MEC8648867.1 RluA family pseudouridine synthase [Actinomycetota bacterium]MED5346043.1 RluA family pseudouridine synthase [Actinomycetota bacterium]